MYKSAAGSLMLLDVNTNPKLYWKGTEVPTLSIMVIDKRVHLKVPANPNLDAVYEDMIASGIRIKEVL